MASASSPDPGSSRQDGTVALAIAALVAATVAIGALAPGGHDRPAPPTITMPDTDPTCIAWSDGCRLCRRLPDGPACSTPGIACTPDEQRCLRRAASP